MLNTEFGDTPMSIFPAADVAGADDAVITFSQPVVISSINIRDTTWGSPFRVEGRLSGEIVWSWESPGDGYYVVTEGAGKEIDTVVFEGRWNTIDNLLIQLPGAPVHPPFRIKEFGWQEGRMQMSWDSHPDWTYQVFKRQSLDTPWTLLETVPSAGARTSFTDPEASADSAFYGVLRLP